MVFYIMIIYLILIIIPLMMIIFGNRFYNNPPNKINMILGYRTRRSMKNADTWEFAHEHIGKTWHLAGWITLGASILALIIVNVLSRLIDLGEGFHAFYFIAALIGAQLVVLIASIFPTESALKMNFDKNGNRIIKE